MKETLTPEKNGWENETQKHQKLISEFLKNYFDKKIGKNGKQKAKKGKYSLTDLEFSGGNPDIKEAVQNGKILATEVSILYGDETAKQIQAVLILGGKEITLMCI